MRVRVGILFGFLLFSCNFPSLTRAAPPDTAGIPDAPTTVRGTLVPTDGLGVRVLSHSGEWTFLPLLADVERAVTTFLISGQLENTSDKPLTYVKLQFELLGEDEIVVFRDYGYNRKAEALREEAYETGQKMLADMGTEEVGVGAHDGFRFFFFKEEVPEFRSYRIRVLETR